ncbi:40019_t:CDS:2, partial [Gigaspora margarita]
VLIMAEIVEVNIDHTEYRIVVKHNELINEAEDIYLSIYSNKVANLDLFSNKFFSTWDSCNLFISEWAKKIDFAQKKIMYITKKHCHDRQEIEIHDALLVETQQILLIELIYLVEGMDNIIEVWSVKVEFTKKIDESSENSSKDLSESLSKDSSKDSSEDEGDNDKENQEFVLLNSKKRHGKGRPAGMKCLKSACKPKKNTKNSKDIVKNVA